MDEIKGTTAQAPRKDSLPVSPEQPIQEQTEVNWKPKALQDLCLKKMNYHPDTGGNIVHFTGDNACFASTNGCSWARTDGLFAKTHKLVRVYKNKQYKATWDPTDIEVQTITKRIEQDAREHPDMYGAGRAVIGMFALGGERDVPVNRTQPRKDIYQSLKNGPCVVTGSCSDIEVDHKNYLYNDPRVGDSKSQRKSDFQSLTKHINDVKRQAEVKMKQQSIRPPASDIPMFAVLVSRLQLPEYTRGGPSYNKDDIHATVGTFWHDPIAFMNDWASLIQARFREKDERIAQKDERIAQLVAQVSLPRNT